MPISTSTPRLRAVAKKLYHHMYPKVKNLLARQRVWWISSMYRWTMILENGVI